MKDSIIKTVPAAEALRKVPQFNPLRYLRQATSRKTGEPVLKLDLRFKKMWFRLACADGRMVLTPMRITDSMAIFEAQVYLHGDDPKPIANFVSTMYAADVPGGRYIQAAQDEALNEALDNAGFGIQLSDLVEAEGGSGYGSEIPMEQIRHLTEGQAPRSVSEEQKAPSPSDAPAPVASERPHAVTEAQETTPEHPSSEKIESVAETLPPAQEPEISPVKSEPPKPADPPQVSEQSQAPNETAGILQMLGTVPPAVSDAAETASATAEPVQEDTAEEQPADTNTYTDDMTIEEITQRMSVDEARSIVVTFGTCKGWTLGEVMDRRASSLRFYLYSAKDAGNVLKAAASLLLDELAMKKAG